MCTNTLAKIIETNSVMFYMIRSRFNDILIFLLLFYKLQWQRVFYNCKLWLFIDALNRLLSSLWQKRKQITKNIVAFVNFIYWLKPVVHQNCPIFHYNIHALLLILYNFLLSLKNILDFLFSNFYFQFFFNRRVLINSGKERRSRTGIQQRCAEACGKRHTK